MGFVTPALLGGAALIAVPIVLHLIMRREPQQLTFPALRFVQQRRTMNQHRLRLRHLLLLALRCAAIALLAFALARPTLRGSGAAGKENAPVATALVFDNSQRLEYQQRNETRLDRAKELAEWLLQQIPAESPVTVVDRGGRHRGTDLDREAASLRVERMDLSAEVRPMADALSDAARWLENKPDHRGEIYVFTDLAEESWPQSTLAEFKQQLDGLAGANVYLIDVGADEPRNAGLGQLRLSSERSAPGGLLRLETDVRAIQPAKDGDAPIERTVELYVVGSSGQAEKRGQQSLAVRGDEAAAVEFTLSGLELGTHQGFVRIAEADALPVDDTRYFSVEVRPPVKVLLLGERPEDTLFLREALAPTASVGLVQPKFACEVAAYPDVDRLRLSDFAAICLVDPPALGEGVWQALRDFVDQGGGLGVSLGRHAQSESMNASAAQKLLPAKLRWRSREATYIRPEAVEHPALGELRPLGDTVPWAEFPVFKFWELEEGEEQAHVVAMYANGKPALVERQVGAGRVLMLTTSVSDPAHTDPWNLLPTGQDPWPFLALANGIVEYLAGVGETRLNYLAGQTVVVPLVAEEQVESYALVMPDDSAVRQPITPGQQELSIAATETLGNYRVRAGGEAERLDRGFSVNLPSDLTRLARADADGLVAALGKERTRVARNQGEIEVRVGLARTGRELFPALILALALVVAAEGLLANRFYAGPSAGAERSNFGLRISDFGLPSGSNPPSAIRHPPSTPVGAGTAETHR
jgi:hypothetical protein